MNDIFSIHTFQNKLYLSIVNVALIKGYFPSYLDQRIFFILIFFTVDDKCILNLESILIYIKEIVVWSFLSLISYCNSFPMFTWDMEEKVGKEMFWIPKSHIFGQKCPPHATHSSLLLTIKITYVCKYQLSNFYFYN